MGGEGEHAVARVRLVFDPEVRIAPDYGLVQAVHRAHLDLRDAVGSNAERELGAPLCVPVLKSRITRHQDDGRRRARNRRDGHAGRLRAVAEGDRFQLQAEGLAAPEAEEYVRLSAAVFAGDC